MSNKPVPEIVIGLVGAIGTDLDAVADELGSSLLRFAYQTEKVRISEGLLDLFETSTRSDAFVDVRIRNAMHAGTELRTKLKRGDAPVALAVQEIRRRRVQVTTAAETLRESTAYVVRSLKHPLEVQRLRFIYRTHFVCLGVYMPRHQRVDHLADQVAVSHGKRAEEYRGTAEELVQIDEKEVGTKLGQNVRDTFPLADYFIDGSDPTKLKVGIERFFDLLFGHPFKTPTRSEFGMFHARAAALRSAALARQVGASICTSEGDVQAVGMNEVPKAGGGHYWPNDDGDARDFARGHDQNDRIKQAVIRELLLELKERRLLLPQYQEMSPDGIVAASSTNGKRLFQDTMLAGVTEFGRDVHAEMSALMTAARLGVSTQKSTMCVTTFPCHNCAKHIVAAGVDRVYYIEPYAKSFAQEFYPDSIAVEGRGNASARVAFTPFEGVAPRKYLEWFQWDDRKDSSGSGIAVKWVAPDAAPRFADPATTGGMDPSYSEREEYLLGEIFRGMKQAGIVT